jgi:DnaJ-class molecular chaperone
LDRLAPLEIRALMKIIDELNYYQILHLERDASAADLKAGYFATKRAFHPDANRHLEPDLRQQCHAITKRVTEAYCVLRDPRKRKIYDEQISDAESDVRIQLSEAMAAHAKAESDERQGRTAQGRQFFLRATEDAQREDWAAAIGNLQMALTFESDNPVFKERLEDFKKRKKESQS